MTRQEQAKHRGGRHGSAFQGLEKTEGGETWPTGRGFRWGDEEVPETDGSCITVRVLLSATELCTST